MISRSPIRKGFRFRFVCCKGILSVLLALAFTAAWLGCMSDGPSTETGNPNLDGSLRDAKGNPVAGTVLLYSYRLPDPPDTAGVSALQAPFLVKSLAVGADGEFRFDSLAAGAYSLEGIDAAGRNFALAAGLRLSAIKDTLQRDLVVKPPARLLGKVTRGPNALPAGVDRNAGILVRVGGANRFAYSDTGGNYALDNVPEGRYRVAFAAQDGHYEPKFLDSVAAVSGETSTLPLVELDWSRYQAPPAVAGLMAAADSSSSGGGVIRLAWHAVKLANLAHYELSRRDSLVPGNDTLILVTDTFYVDIIPGAAAGHNLIYKVTAVNALGNRGPEEAGSGLPVIASVNPDPLGGPPGSLEGVILQGNTPVTGATVRLFASPGLGSPDSLLKPAPVLNSAITGADGRYRFADLAAGRYTVAAAVGATGMIGAVGEKAAIRIGLIPRPDQVRAGSARLDSLEPMATGSVEGFASRDSLWVTDPRRKGDEGILVGLAGTPFQGTTNYDAQGKPFFSLTGIPPGGYRLVVQAGPEGYFLPDTLAVTVLSGTATRLAAMIKARYNPGAPPPKIASLGITASSRASVSLAWSSVRRYAPLKGYLVLRLDGDSRETARSALLTSPAYTDDISALPSGTRIFYVVKVVSQAGLEGEAGGAGGSGGVPFTVP